jgi:hypothetical protein
MRCSVSPARAGVQRPTDAGEHSPHGALTRRSAFLQKALDPALVVTALDQVLGHCGLLIALSRAAWADSTDHRAHERRVKALVSPAAVQAESQLLLSSASEAPTK